MTRKPTHLPGILTDAQLKAELVKCEYCEEKPCREACPAHCSPADFIMAARGGTAADFRRSALMILGANPLGTVCGIVCPDQFCMKACVYNGFTTPVAIPAVQATIITRARNAGPLRVGSVPGNGENVAVIGAGPAGLAAAAVLTRRGYAVTIHETSNHAGGMTRLIPGFRLAGGFIDADIEFIRSLGSVRFMYAQKIGHPERMLGSSCRAVIIASGQEEPVRLDIPGAGKAIGWETFLSPKYRRKIRNLKVAVIGGGAVAVDCAVTAKRRGAAHVELIYRRRPLNMPLTAAEREMLVEENIEVTGSTRPVELVCAGGKVRGLRLVHLTLRPGASDHPENFQPRKAEPPYFREFDIVITAIGAVSRTARQKTPGLFYAGDLTGESSTVVEAVASGKKAADCADRYLRGTAKKRPCNSAPAPVILEGVSGLPVGLTTKFFGKAIASPFLLSAAPHTDGYAQMRAAYERGWAGGVMKTAFDRVPIHIPSEYMYVLAPSTYGNCDNVSGHQLDRVCREIERLVREYPDRLTLGSTGGPVSGRETADRRVWQANTAKLERAGAMGVEYSLSCPQGGDGTKGDMVSQDAELTARIVGWVMESGDPEIPKLFKLTGAVTAIGPIVTAIADVLRKYPGKKAGITLANSFPAMAYRTQGNGAREEGVVIGMSGEGVLPITSLVVAKASGLGVPISANGGVMDYRGAARLLALGAETVQCCTIVMKYGLGIVDELHSGLSHFLHARGYASVGDLIGSSLPQPIIPFDMLPATRTIPAVTESLCCHCGNCARCPYLAITMNRRIVPEFDPSLCVGCSLCAQKCFSGAIAMRPRSRAELSVFREG